jgi:predicted transcriptional regulator
MKNTKKSVLKAANAALISIHPGYVEKIVSGEKRFEFRRGWAALPVDFLVIYATSPVQRIVAIVEVGRTIRGSRSSLWRLARDEGGGISRRKLFAYLAGKKEGVAIELIRRMKLGEALDPLVLFGEEFRPPQSFRYLNQDELKVLAKQLGGAQWE